MMEERTSKEEKIRFVVGMLQQNSARIFNKHEHFQAMRVAQTLLIFSSLTVATLTEPEFPMYVV